MMEDSVSNLLRKVARGEVSVEDAREVLEGVELTEQEIDAVIEHGVHSRAELGTIVSASLAPSGGSYLIMLFFTWGIFFTLMWAFSFIYGLAMDWDQQQLSFHLQ